MMPRDQAASQSPPTASNQTTNPDVASPQSNNAISPYSLPEVSRPSPLTESGHPVRRTSTPKVANVAEIQPFFSVSAVHLQDRQPNGNVCAGCGLVIWDRTLLSALDRNWHNHCLKCHLCGGRLADMGASFFLRSNMFFCRQDYLKLFGVAGVCTACQTTIPPDEMVMRCHKTVYHLRCFNCSLCHSPLLPGERYLQVNGSLFCEHEFARLLPTSQASSTPPASPAVPAPPPTTSASPSTLRPILSPQVLNAGGGVFGGSAVANQSCCAAPESSSGSTNDIVTQRQKSSDLSEPEGISSESDN
ncbi:unnamed protein product [Mesocestoides corti]|uniref:LIM zinc-binding domain-containing protein n=1 Tax=Mesocestoides corti TaxID=53468 RepID=A0A0R3UA27_MESCO|nr:unnamed protein product [Mesocestoides corti]